MCFYVENEPKREYHTQIQNMRSTLCAMSTRERDRDEERKRDRIAIKLVYGSSSKTCYFVPSIFPWKKCGFFFYFFFFHLEYIDTECAMELKRQRNTTKICLWLWLWNAVSCRVMPLMNSLCIFMRSFDHRARPKSWSRRWRCDSPRTNVKETGFIIYFLTPLF